MAKEQVLYSRCRDMEPAPRTAWEVWVDTETNVVTTNTPYTYLTSICKANLLQTSGEAPGDVIHTYCNEKEGKEYRVVFLDTSPFGIAQETGILCQGCNGRVAVTSTTPESKLGAEDGTANIMVDKLDYDIAVGVTNPCEIYLNGQLYHTFTGTDYQLQITGLIPGQYNILARWGDGCETAAAHFTIEPGIANIWLEVTTQNPSFKGASDGSATVSVFNGSGNYDVLWFDRPDPMPGLVRSNMVAGSYFVMVTDTDTGNHRSISVIITEPDAAAPRGADTFYCSPAQGVHLIQSDELPEGVDNTHYNKLKNIGISRLPYEQKAELLDPVSVQALSNCVDNKIIVLDGYTLAPVASYNMVQVASFTNINETHQGYLKDNGDGRTRAYYNTPEFPTPIGIGSNLQITNTPDSDGIYSVQATGKEDSGSEYVILNFAYAEVTPTTECSLTSFFNKKEYDVWEGGFVWEEIGEGHFVIKVQGTDSEGLERFYLSELYDVAEKHDGTLLIRYRNNSTHLDMFYLNGFTNTFRVEGTLLHLLPAVEKITHDDCGELVNLDSKYERQKELRVFGAPAYLHERVGIALSHDYIEVDGIVYQTRGGYDKPQYLGRTLFANGTAILIQKGFARFMQQDGIPIEGDGGYLSHGEGLIKY